MHGGHPDHEGGPVLHPAHVGPVTARGRDDGVRAEAADEPIEHRATQKSDPGVAPRPRREGRRGIGVILQHQRRVPAPGGVGELGDVVAPRQQLGADVEVGVDDAGLTHSLGEVLTFGW